MNEKIKELIVQAQKEVWGNCPYNGSPEFEGYELDAEKFAEMIVKETMQVVANQLPSNQYLDVAHAVIEHFGVEE
jgi:hypothetical protein